MTDSWDDWDDELDQRWELTEKAIEAEGLADKIAERFWLDREDVWELLTEDSDEEEAA